MATGAQPLFPSLEDPPSRTAIRFPERELNYAELGAASAELARRIDQAVGQRLATENVHASPRADDAELRKQIVGLWTLVSVVYEDQETKERTPVLGEHPHGRQLATADGRWLALVTADGRPVPTTRR